MKYYVGAASCDGSIELVRKYGDKLKMFKATINGGELKIPTFKNDDEEWNWNMNVKNCVTVEINSIEVLRDFIGTFGSCIVSQNGITIYDDYIE